MVEISLSGSGEGLGASQPRGYSTRARRGRGSGLWRRVVDEHRDVVGKLAGHGQVLHAVARGSGFVIVGRSHNSAKLL